MARTIVKVGMKPSHPGKWLLTEVIEPYGLTITAAAKVLGVRRATLSDLLNGKTSLSPEMALRFDKAFGVSLEMMLRMQAWYDSVEMKERANDIVLAPYKPASTAAS